MRTTRSASSRSASGSWPGGSSASTASPSIGLGILTRSILVAIVGPFFMPLRLRRDPRSPDQIVYAGRPPSLAHPFGETGGLQRDVLTLVVNGARTSLFIGFCSMLIGVIIGTIVGSIAGYLGGFVDNLLMRVVDVMLSLPILFVILVAARFFGGARRHRLVDHRDLRPVQLDGGQPPRAEPLPVHPRTRVRRGGAGRRRSRPADHLPAHPAERLQPDRRRGVADRRRQHHRRGVRQLPRLRRRPDLADLGQHPVERPDVHPAWATGGGRSSRASRSS